MRSSRVRVAGAVACAAMVLVSGCSSASATPTVASTTGGPSTPPAVSAAPTGAQSPTASPDSQVVVAARSAGGTCSAGFIAYTQRGTTGTGNSAMAVNLTYCGSGTRTFEAFPALSVADAVNRPLAVTVQDDKTSAPTTPLTVPREVPVCVVLSWKPDTRATALHAAIITFASATGRDAFTVAVDASLNATSPVLVTTAWVPSSGDCIGS
jgi:hypothetical protein